MTETLGVAEAKRRFSELLDRVRAGERFIIARRGKPDAVLAPPDQVEATRPKPLGFLSLVGAMADLDPSEAEAFQETMKEVVASRRKAKDREVPYFDDYED
jgi:prevent-host-death family protein